ncbi:MAG: DUF1800 domain-containing protein [Pseudomonadota bacterium]
MRYRLVRGLLIRGMFVLSGLAAMSATSANGANPTAAITASDWDLDAARHLIDRAGFGAWDGELEALFNLGPQGAVRRIVDFEGASPTNSVFEHSGIHDPGLEPFPPSRPATTNLAKRTGEALGIKVKPSGNRRLQPVVNKFFYWLRASRLETDRVAYWWANRMLTSERPLQEKMALLWHGHFAINEAKVRDYRKHLRQLDVLQRHGMGNFRDLLTAVAKGPGMLAFLDAGVNIKGSPNENFAREIMELFTMGVEQYQEHDIREAARAFTGWNYQGLDFVLNQDDHDVGEKEFLGHRGAFTGDDIIELILREPVTAEFLTAKIYRYFVHEDPDPATITAFAEILRGNNYELRPLLRAIFSSRDFYSDRARASRIKGPVEFVVSTYKGLGLTRIPGVPDFNRATAALGQRLFHPPTVAGWAEGRSWITPGLLIARGNFARSVLFPDINFIPYDRFPPDPKIREVSRKIARGFDISSATIPTPKNGQMSMSNMLADRDEDFNTRYGSYKGWQMAIQRVRPIVRDMAPVALAQQLKDASVTTVESAVDYLSSRFLVLTPDAAFRTALIRTLESDLGSSQLADADSYLEEPLRRITHLLMSAPEYQLN